MSESTIGRSAESRERYKRALETQIAASVLPDKGQRFTGEDFRNLRMPGVYVLLKGDEVLYVGYGVSLLRRIGTDRQEYARDSAIQACDQVLLYPCQSIGAARRVERILINQLQPRFNVRLGAQFNAITAVRNGTLSASGPET